MFANGVNKSVTFPIAARGSCWGDINNGTIQYLCFGTNFFPDGVDEIMLLGPKHPHRSDSLDKIYRIDGTFLFEVSMLNH